MKTEARNNIYNIGAAKTHLSRLIEQVERGEDVVIARDGVPVVRLSAVKPRGVKLGVAKHVIDALPDFDEPMSDAEYADWGLN